MSPWKNVIAPTQEIIENGIQDERNTINCQRLINFKSLYEKEKKDFFAKVE